MGEYKGGTPTKGVGWCGSVIINEQREVIIPAAVAIDRASRKCLPPRSLTALIFGDPPYGRAASEFSFVKTRQFKSDPLDRLIFGLAA